MVSESAEESFFLLCGYTIDPALFIDNIAPPLLLCGVRLSSISGQEYVSLHLDYLFHWSGTLPLQY